MLTWLAAYNTRAQWQLSGYKCLTSTSGVAGSIPVPTSERS